MFVLRATSQNHTPPHQQRCGLTTVHCGCCVLLMCTGPAQNSVRAVSDWAGEQNITKSRTRSASSSASPSRSLTPAPAAAAAATQGWRGHGAQ